MNTYIKAALCGLCLATSVGAYADILRVNNIPGTAAYTSFSDAMTAANPGDTIMVESSPNTYGQLAIDKAITVIGPGYDLVTNGIMASGANNAQFDGIRITADNVNISGLYIKAGTLRNIAASYVTITRCRINAQLNFITYERDKVKHWPSHIVIHQNMMDGYIVGTYTEGVSGGCVSYMQCTNNIMTGTTYTNTNDAWVFSYISHSTFRNNTIIYTKPMSQLCKNVFNSTFENNLIYSSKASAIVASGTEAAINNCKIINQANNPFAAALNNDKAMRDVELSLEENDGTYGAFSTSEFSDPYVISGQPVGPTITSLTAPASVQKGTDMKVVVNVSMSR